MARDVVCEVLVPDVRSALSPGQIAAAGFDSVILVGWDELIEQAIVSDVVVCGLSGLPILTSTAEPQRSGPVHRVLFADQPTVPARPASGAASATG